MTRAVDQVRGRAADRGNGEAAQSDAQAEIMAGRAAAREITRANARNFYYGMRLTPEPKRSALFAVYAWMREADDIVDSLRPEAATELAAFDATTREMLAGRGPREGYWPALAWAIREFSLSARWFHDLLSGVARDLEGRPVETWRELLWYADCVGSTAGLCSIAIWGRRSPGVDAEALTIARGRAFQLINILRDVRTDWAEFRRVYLPGELLRRHELSIESLIAWSEPAAAERVVRAGISEARRWMEESRPLDELVHEDGFAALRVMTRIYEGLLDRIDHDPRLAVRIRAARVPTARKLAIVSDTVLRSIFR